MKILPLIAVVGRPNVGKSTLYNRMAGGRPALVRDEAGTTRDRSYSPAEWDSFEFMMMDTGGVTFDPKHSIEKKTSEQAMLGVEEADLLWFVFDGRLELGAEDKEWLEWSRRIDKPKIYVANKVDRAQDERLPASFYETGISKWVYVSAETGRNVGELLDLSVLSLFPDRTQEKKELDKADFSISLIGRPNAGKSTLLNRLLGEERSVVDSTPGTTRDAVDSILNVDDQKLCFIDTAGIRRKGKTNQVLEKFSIIRSIQAIERSDCVCLLLDGEEGVAEQDAHVAGEAFKRHKALIVIVNKWDIGALKWTREEFQDQVSRKLRFIDNAPILYMSAKTGSHTEELIPLITRVRAQYEKRVPTHALNEDFEKIIGSHPLPVYGGRDIKIFYATQAGTKPPTFVVFANQPSKIHFSYERYLINSLKKKYGFNDVPLKIIFKQST